MANTKNTKNAAEIVDNEDVVETKPAAKKAPRKFAQDELVMCRSVTYGELLLPGKKSKLLYTFANYGDRTEIEFQDLQALRSTRSKYLTAPLFVIEDEELIDQWPEFKDLYSKVAAMDVDSLFALPKNQFEKQLRNLPVGFRDAIKNIASAKISDGSLDSISKINAIDEILGTDLKFFIQ